MPFVPIFVARRWLQTWRSESPRSMERHTCLETSVVWVFNKGWENNKNVPRMFQIYLRCLRMHQERHLMIGWNWNSFDMRLVSGLAWTCASETVQQLVHDPWVSFSKKKTDNVCSLSQHVLFPSASHVPFQGRQLPALASSLESLHLCGLEVIKSSISRHLSGSEIQDKSDHVPSPIRWSCDKTSQIRCFKTLCVLHHPGSCSSQDSGATRTMREPSILISLAGSAECTWLGHRSCHSELDMWKVFWHMHRMQQNCACFILIILEGSLNHYCCRYFPFCEICSLKKHCRAYVRTDSC